MAATALLEIGKKRPEELIMEMEKWSVSKDPDIRRTSSEGLRGIARKNPEKILNVLEKLKSDNEIYVKKSVANVLRNAGRYDPEFVLGLCAKWAKLKNSDTNWIIKDGLRKLKESHKTQVEDIMGGMS